MSNRIELGVITGMANDLVPAFDEIRGVGLSRCQVACWEPAFYTKDNIQMVKAACAGTRVEISALWTGYPGPQVWNFIEGPTTIGLVPPEYRAMRVDALIAGAEFAAECGVFTTATHAGFIPENPRDPLYAGTIEALTKVAVRCKELGVTFTFETGQETPTTLMRAIQDIGTNNLGINLDPANLLMYGKANPVDALDLLGPLVRGVHGKDGEYPTNPNELGEEKPLGEGKVNYPVFLPKLRSFGFEGSVTIEREISGPQQIADIKRAIEILSPLCA